MSGVLRRKAGRAGWADAPLGRPNTSELGPAGTASLIGLYADVVFQTVSFSKSNHVSLASYLFLSVSVPGLNVNVGPKVQRVAGG